MAAVKISGGKGKEEEPEEKMQHISLFVIEASSIKV